MYILHGYRSLDFLKSALLPADMGECSDYDDDLERIGAGVADLFDQITGRILRRTVGAVHECAADVSFCILTSYPVEAITSVTITIHGMETELTGAVSGQVKKAGIVHFNGTLGTSEDTLSITSTGGYWCDDGTTLPSGATALPSDLLNAWIQQCRATCEAEDTFRQKGAGKPDGKGIGLTGLETLPGVMKTLNRYMRTP